MNDNDLDQMETEKENTVELESDKKEKKLKPKEQIQRLTAENYSLREKYLSAQADLENYKKRMNKEKIEDRKYAAMDLIHELLIPLEQLRKVVNMQVNDDKLKNFLIGFKMINDQIYEALKEQGLEEIEALGKVFDPKYHYAVEKDNNNEVANDLVTDVTQTGYMFKERILRPAMVKVNEWSEKENE